ncbi:FecR family protein [Pseudomonas sp.]|uniref:FecR family protein n=1 Tax=Pseudomonas sp. TaxID=306 RepID=UPI0037C5FDD8
MISHDLQNQQIRQAAAEWAVRLDGACLDDEQQRLLQQWLQADSRHAPALALAQQTWAALANLPPPVRSQPQRRSAPASAALPIRRQRPRLRRWLASASLVLLVVVGLFQGPQWLLPLQVEHFTARGEVRSFALPDGSEAILDSSSAIRLNYSADTRQVELLAGSAIFQVAPLNQSEPRPFVVISAGGRAQALGTRFVVVRENAEQAWVGVLEHRVAVSAGGEPLVLKAGDSVRYDHVGIERQQFDVRRATSWQRGLLVFDRVPLAQVVEELNRYRRGRILLTRAELGTRQVSGVFRLDSLDDALATLTAELQAQRTDLPLLSLVY